MARILVGMSGGVDSSVAAALLAREGHQVTGVTLKLWDGEDDPEAPWQERSCCKVGIARHVCDTLDIPHVVVDMRDLFRQRVVDDFLEGYLRGDTPNPCVRCNEAVKFSGLLGYAEREGHDQVATGHYARIERTGTGGYRLLKGADPAKDQSYFLYRIPRTHLARVRLPLGSLRKPQVMEMARSMGFPADEIAESQEICFVGAEDYRAFLTQERPESVRPGEIVDTSGKVVGHHDGVAFHTIGQRRGLNVALGRRVYVVNTDPATDRVVVGDPDDLLGSSLLATDLNMLAPLTGDRVTAKIRYRSPAVPASARVQDGRMEVTFDTPQRAITPGQSVVLYQGDTVVGGGIIAAAGAATATEQTLAEAS